MILFFLALGATSGYFIYKFTVLHSLFGPITQVMLYLMNVSLLWMSAVEMGTLCLLVTAH